MPSEKCQGKNGKCGNRTGLKDYTIGKEGVAEPVVVRVSLCPQCSGSLEDRGYTVKQIARLPDCRMKNKKEATATWQQKEAAALNNKWWD